MSQQYRTKVLVNVATDAQGRSINYNGYQLGQPLALVTETGPHGAALTLQVTAATVLGAADLAWKIGNRQGSDTAGNCWPHDVRSVSVGDILRITDEGGHTVHLAVASRGFDLIDVPAHQVDLSGTSATSRPAR